MMKRFFLVGAIILIAPGSLMQLVVGTLAAAVFLLMQVQARPYRRAADNFLRPSVGQRASAT